MDLLRVEQIVFASIMVLTGLVMVVNWLMSFEMQWMATFSVFPAIEFF